MRSLAGAAAAAATTAVVLTCRSRLLKKYVDLICSSIGTYHEQTIINGYSCSASAGQQKNKNNII
ncbi:hypothetical protein TYRP_018365 [Tyrophagus putrescentiae]|nr:hypothetical protein TYRP_018365 [Tyrophagus putrescentiae]